MGLAPVVRSRQNHVVHNSSMATLAICPPELSLQDSNTGPQEALVLIQIVHLGGTPTKDLLRKMYTTFMLWRMSAKDLLLYY
ncbi:hypothetical protein NDU88_000337 [Pleurodeles waltl]|uniref:Uncharacterized protein n=1 Tax=Pleurodeles waltl TaxID=8319 RepID=A0AAV7V7K9_PLEWA|nr:hypothetical protein NDU88_000337 [Pleurodeles waltl]